jgi:hypothetical protein
LRQPQELSELILPLRIYLNASLHVQVLLFHELKAAAQGFFDAASLRSCCTY